MGRKYMEKIEFGLNAFHYSIYFIHNEMHLAFNKINPLRLIHKLPFQKRRYEKLGIDIDKEIYKAFANKQSGISVTVAGGALMGILFFLIMGGVHLIIKILSLNIIFNIAYFIVFVAISVIISYFCVFKEDKYLKFFDEFEKWSKLEKRKNAYLCIGFIVGTAIIFFGSFII